jgi:hypothetical protein
MHSYDLERNGILFFDEPGQHNTPAHVNALRSTLLDFDCTISERLGIYQEDEYEYSSDLISILSKFPFSERTLIDKSLERYRQIKREALVLSEGKEREREWVDFFSSYFFSPLAQQAKVSEEDSRRYVQISNLN